MRLYFTISDIMSEQEKKKAIQGIAGLIDTTLINNNGYSTSIEFEASFIRRMESSSLFHKTPYNKDPYIGVDYKMLNQQLNQQLSQYSDGLFTIKLRGACNDINNRCSGPSALSLLRINSSIYCLFEITPTSILARQRYLEYTNNQIKNYDSSNITIFAKKLISFTGKLSAIIYPDGVGDYEGTWRIEFNDFSLPRLDSAIYQYRFALLLSEHLKMLGRNSIVRAYPSSLGLPCFEIVDA